MGLRLGRVIGLHGHCYPTMLQVVCGGTGVTIPGPYEHRLIIALCVEILITMLLVLVFLGVSDPDRGDAVKDLGGIAVGLALAVGHWVGVRWKGPGMTFYR